MSKNFESNEFESITDSSRSIVLKFLTKSFVSIVEIKDFTFDYFPEVYRALGVRTTFNDCVVEIMNYCEKQANYDVLWKAIEQERPKFFEQYYPAWEKAREQEETYIPEAASDDVSNDEPTSKQPRKLRVFLCHGSEDKVEVRNLYRKLRDDGADPWLDEENLLPGQRWQDEIPKAVQNSDVALICLSEHSTRRDGYIQEEIRFALDIAERQREQIFLIPVKLEECQVPPRLKDYQWVNLREEKGYQRLIRALQQCANRLAVQMPKSSGTYTFVTKSTSRLTRRQLVTYWGAFVAVLGFIALLVTIGDSGMNLLDRLFPNSTNNKSLIAAQSTSIPSETQISVFTNATPALDFPADFDANQSLFDAVNEPGDPQVLFDVIDLEINGVFFTSIEIGPDGLLYGATNNGQIRRYAISSDGTLSNEEILSGVASDESDKFPNTPRLLIGLTFDPNSTASNLVAWTTHTVFGFENIGQRWGGKISRLSGPNLENVQDIFVNLPRSAKDHVTDSITFGPDDRLYLSQGSNLSAGAPDNAWGTRPETLLSAAILVFDDEDPAVRNAISSGVPVNVKTGEAWDGGGESNADTSVGTYNPYATNAPLKVFATGIHDAYDLVWHSNGYLYVPTNGTAGGGESPDFPMNGTDYSYCSNVRADGRSASQLPTVDGINNNSGATGVQGTHELQRDFMFIVGPNGGGYFGHPNPARCEWVLNIGNSLADKNEPGEGSGGSKYPVGTQPDPNYRGYPNIPLNQQVFAVGFNKSPNGIIEYKSDRFDGELKGRLLVARFSNNNDIIVIQVDNDGSILGAQAGIDIPGFSNAPGQPYNDPLEIGQNAATGDLYLSQYDRGGDNQKLWLLRPIDE